jgi:SAM-dependent methyltransferase
MFSEWNALQTQTTTEQTRKSLFPMFCVCLCLIVWFCSVDQHSKLFDAYYFVHDGGRPYQRSEEWLHFSAAVADRIVSDIHPTSVLDAGCAMGLLIEALRERSVQASGLDISEYAIQQVHPAVQPYCRLGSITEPLAERYDLIISTGLAKMIYML